MTKNDLTSELREQLLLMFKDNELEQEYFRKCKKEQIIYYAIKYTLKSVKAFNQEVEE